VLSGTPTGVGSPPTGGTYTFTISATDISGLATNSPNSTIVVYTSAIPTPPTPFVLYGKNIPLAKPQRRIIDDRSLVYGLSGKEQPYPVYQFSHGRARWEYPGHNPFASEDEDNNP
jgi:hypothetical protein